ncbi:CYTH domain-containing protein [Kiritimatiellaeota bacterium B1221]|nr:CYTH domain-containing protein [Kiritimatiellaeota bacterium B1221]
MNKSYEIERKFLIQTLPDLRGVEYHFLRQGYLTTGETEVRLRDEPSRYLLTVKQGSGLVRMEEEVELSEDQFMQLWPLTEGQRIEKKRYRIPEGDYVVELDVYEKELASLVVAEVEFPSEQESRDFPLPAYLGSEVTDDARYKNKNLAVRGKPV